MVIGPGEGRRHRHDHLSKAGTPVTISSVVNTADDTARYAVTTSQKVKLKLEVADAGIQGDHRGSSLSTPPPTRWWRTRNAATDIPRRRQRVVRHPRAGADKRGTLIVYYCSGIDSFSAHQWTQCTPNKSGVTIGFTGG
jgi:hypothetical protein